MKYVAIALAVGLAAVGTGCSGSGDGPERRNVSPGTTPALSVAEAKRAIKRYSRFNATGAARSIQNCRSKDGATTCAVEYKNACDVLAVTRTAGKLTISQVGGLCLYLTDVSTSTSAVP